MCPAGGTKGLGSSIKKLTLRIKKTWEVKCKALKVSEQRPVQATVTGCNGFPLGKGIYCCLQAHQPKRLQSLGGKSFLPQLVGIKASKKSTCTRTQVEQHMNSTIAAGIPGKVTGFFPSEEKEVDRR